MGQKGLRVWVVLLGVASFLFAGLAGCAVSVAYGGPVGGRGYGIVSPITTVGILSWMFGGIGTCCFRHWGRYLLLLGAAITILSVLCIFPFDPQSSYSDFRNAIVLSILPGCAATLLLPSVKAQFRGGELPFPKRTVGVALLLSAWAVADTTGGLSQLFHSPVTPWRRIGLEQEKGFPILLPSYVPAGFKAMPYYEAVDLWAGQTYERIWNGRVSFMYQVPKTLERKRPSLFINETSLSLRESPYVAFGLDDFENNLKQVMFEPYRENTIGNSWRRVDIQGHLGVLAAGTREQLSCRLEFISGQTFISISISSNQPMPACGEEVVKIARSMRVKKGPQEGSSSPLPSTVEELERWAEQQVEAVVQTFQSQYIRSDPKDRLKEMGPSVEVLTKYLKHQNMYVRREIVSVLGDMGQKARKALPLLIERLEDEDFQTRGRAAGAMVKVAPDAPEVVPHLSALLKDSEYYVRRVSVLSLCEIKPVTPEVVEAITIATSDRSPDVRDVAVRCLGEIRPEFASSVKRSPSADIFSEGLAPIQMMNGKWGYVDETQHVVIEPRFDSAMDFSEGLALVSRDGRKWGYIDRTGRMVLSPPFLNVDAGRFREGLAPVQVVGKPGEEGGWGYMDKKGTIVIPANFDYAWEFSEGLARIKWAGKFTYVRPSGHMLTAPRFDAALDFSEGLAPVALRGKFGFIDTTGKVVIEPQFDRAEPFSGGVARVWRGAIAHAIDKNGHDIGEPTR